MKTKKSRILSLFLAIVMIATMVPFAALSVSADTYIGRVDIALDSDVLIEGTEIGDGHDFIIETEGVKYYFENDPWDWIRTGVAISDNEIIEMGYTYYVETYITPEAGYYFDENTVVYVNDAEPYECSTDKDGDIYILTQDFYPYSAGTKVVDRVDLTLDSDEFIEGTKIYEGHDFIVETDGVDFYYTSDYWDWYEQGEILEPDFVIGSYGIYYAKMWLRAKSGYVFNYYTDVYINGMPAWSAYKDFEGDLLVYTDDYYVNQNSAEIIDYIEISMITDELVAGSNPYDLNWFYIETEGVKFYHDVDSWFWRCQGDPVVNGELLRTNLLYYASFWLTPEEGYAFDEQVEVYVNDQIVDYTKLDEEGDLLVLTQEFTVTDEISVIDRVNLTLDSDKLVVGTKPDEKNLFTIDTEGVEFYWDGPIAWEWYTDDASNLGDFEILDNTEYQAYMWLTPAEGYVFSRNIQVYINGELVAEVSVDKVGDILVITKKYTSVSEGTTTPEGQKGDVNGDGKINGTDFMQVRRHFLGLYTIPEEKIVLADVNGDGKINSTDFMQIRRHFLGLYVIV